jgi:hypothetical protein
MPPMLAAYRATGADPPFGDPRGYHGVGMEGHFWRFTQPRTGAVAIVILAISRDAQGHPWAMASLAAHPGGGVRSATLADAWAAPRGLAVRCGDAFAADERSLRVDLGADARLEATFAEPLQWPRRAFGALGPAHAVPGLSQYWHPWLLRARVTGSARVGADTIDLDGAVAYAEKNWGAGGMPQAWWWGQAHGFGGDGTCVAFAGGRAGLGALRVPAGSLVVALPGELLRIVRPPAPLRVDVGNGGWRLRGRTLRDVVEVEGHAGATPTHRLPVPVPTQRRVAEAWSEQHLAGTVQLVVRRGGRVRFRGVSELAGLEQGRGH